MELLFLGTGGGIRSSEGTTPANYSSNMILTAKGKKLLIDCGDDIEHALAAHELDFTVFHDIYLSHLHFDHAGGLGWLALSNKFARTDSLKPNLYLHHSLEQPLWENALKAGLSTLDESPATLSTFYSVHPISEPSTFEWQGISFSLIQTVHIYNNHELMPSYGLLFKTHSQTVFITTDTRFTPDILQPYYEQADLIFHDCETLSKPSGVHAHFNQLKTLDPAIREKMWLYHYNGDQLPDAKRAGFKGFVSCGQTFEI